MSAFDVEVTGELEPRVVYPSMGTEAAMTLTMTTDGDPSLRIAGHWFADDPDFPKRLVIFGMCLLLWHVLKPR